MPHRLTVFFLLLIVAVLNLQAEPIDVLPLSEQLLSRSSIYLDRHNSTFETAVRQTFRPFSDDHINLSFDAKTVVWVKLELYNASDEMVERILEVGNPLLEQVTLFDGAVQKKAGMLYIGVEQHHLNPSFFLRFAPKEQKTVWLRVQNRTTAVQFGVALKNIDLFYHDDQLHQGNIMIFFGIIFAFMSYALLLFIYMKDRSYLFYTFYLATLLFQQMTYVGYLPLHAPPWFTRIDAAIVVPKVALMIIAASWFAQHFLRTVQYKKIHRTYNLFVLFLFVQMPLVGTSWFYLPELTVLTGLVFIVFNTYVGVYVYRKGNKQARFFIAGWTVLIMAYLLMIFDALGFISVMHFLPNLLMWATAFEAMFLLLAFIDQLNILQRQKDRLHEEFVIEYNLRQNIIGNEVAEKTAELSTALSQKKLLFKELHHRVKNNLQLILSLFRLQSDKYECDAENVMLQQLEGRVRAISRTHEILYQNDESEMIDMRAYVDSYLDEMDIVNDRIVFESRINAVLPLREAGYVGLIINELVLNAAKHAYGEEGGVVFIGLHQNMDEYILEVSDAGRGYNVENILPKSLGLSLVRTLVYGQLEGTIGINNEKGAHYMIRFSL